MSFSVSRREFVAAIGAASVLTARGYSAIVGANDRLRMAVIGAGIMATEHMESLVKARDLDNLEIVNVCDVYQKRLEAAAHLTNAKPVEDYRRILDSKDIDWVLIATPEHWHFQMAMDALDAGKHVYVGRKSRLESLARTGSETGVGSGALLSLPALLGLFGRHRHRFIYPSCHSPH